MALGEKIYAELKAKGIEVLLDDRRERAGVKFKDAELMGIPIRINVGKQAAEGQVEFKLRKDGSMKDAQVDELYSLIEEVFQSEGLSL